MNDKIAQTQPDGSVDKPDELVPQITIDGVSYSMFEFDETVEFKRTGELNNIGFARACYMTTVVDVYKNLAGGDAVFCGEVVLNDDEEEVDINLVNRQCIELIVGCGSE